MSVVHEELYVMRLAVGGGVSTSFIGAEIGESAFAGHSRLKYPTQVKAATLALCYVCKQGMEVVCDVEQENSRQFPKTRHNLHKTLFGNVPNSGQHTISKQGPPPTSPSAQ